MNVALHGLTHSVSTVSATKIRQIGDPSRSVLLDYKRPNIDVVPTNRVQPPPLTVMTRGRRRCLPRVSRSAAGWFGEDGQSTTRHQDG